ncbi:MAG TPA: hypothetical protein VFG94_09540 [Acidimicrobiales bacterium]|nr:hypothetical protein [Acidimicrobiales bacterium]
MKCEGCRAEIMLGSAQCGRCGRPIVGAVPDPTVSAAGRSRLLPPTPSAWRAPSGSPLPPPPPPQLGAPPTRASRPAAQAGGQTQTKGCGCGALLWFIVLLSIGSAIAGVIAGRADDDGNGATASPATTSFSAIDLRDFEGPTIAAPSVGVGTSTVHDLSAGTIAVHPLRCEQACTIAVTPVSGFDSVIRVVGLDGVVVAEDDDGGDGLGSLVALTATPAPGTELWVIDFSGDPGSYSVLVTPTVG